MEIKRAHVTFHQAILLKGNGMIRPFFAENYFRTNGELCINMNRETFDSDIHFFAFEQWQVVEWLYETYGIDVSVIPVRERGAKVVYFQYRIIDFRDDKVDEVLYEHQYNTYFDSYSTKRDAYSAAFDYVLNKLI